MTKNHSESYRAGGILLDPAGRILLMERNDGAGWLLPTVHRKPVEDPLVVARTELQKIMIGEIRSVAKLGTYERYSTVRGNSRHITNITFFLFEAETDQNAFYSQWFTLDEAATALDNKEKEFLSASLPQIHKFLKKRKNKSKVTEDLDFK